MYNYLSPPSRHLGEAPIKYQKMRRCIMQRVLWTRFGESFARTTDEVMPAGIQIEIDSLVRLNCPVHSVEHLTWIA